MLNAIDVKKQRNTSPDEINAVLTISLKPKKYKSWFLKIFKHK